MPVEPRDRGSSDAAARRWVQSPEADRLAHDPQPGGKRGLPERPQRRPPEAGDLHHRRIAAEREAENGDEQDHALDDRRVVGAHAQHEEDVDHDGERERTEDRADGATPATADERAPQHDGGEDLQQHLRADQRVSAAHVGGDEEAGRAVAHAGEGEGEEAHTPHIHAVGLRRSFVAADGVDSRADPRVLQQQPEQNGDCQDDDGGGQALGHQVAGEDQAEVPRHLAAGELEHEQRRALGDEHGGERHHDRLQADIGDEEAVDGADGRAQAERDDQRDEGEEAGPHIGGGSELGDQDHVDERDYRARREVEPARKDDDGLAERGERERRGARADAADVEIGDALAGDELQREHGGGEHGDGDDRAALT